MPIKAFAHHMPNAFFETLLNMCPAQPPGLTYIEEGAAIVARCWLALVCMRAVLCTGVWVHNLSPAAAITRVAVSYDVQFLPAGSAALPACCCCCGLCHITYTRLAPYLGTPKFAMATFILQPTSKGVRNGCQVLHAAASWAEAVQQ